MVTAKKKLEQLGIESIDIEEPSSKVEGFLKTHKWMNKVAITIATGKCSEIIILNTIISNHLRDIIYIPFSGVRNV
jgi:hypothetical protein